MNNNMNKGDTEKVVENKALDLSNAGRGVWLVKVPKYIAQKWEMAPSDMDVGKLRICKKAGQKSHVSLSLTPAVVNLKPEEKVPTEHILDVSVVTKQTLGVFSYGEASGSGATGSNDKNKNTSVGDNTEKEKIYMEGRIVQKLECRPIADTTYMKLKLESIRKAAVPQRKVVSLDRVVNNFKPINDHAHNIKYRESKKAEGKKARDDKTFVMDILFKAFEKHQYYNIKDLVKLTKQPIGYLKEILKEVCDYNMKNPHRNMWELKQEYRHYSTEDKKEKPNSDSDSN